MISCHEEYFGCKASWNYIEAAHGNRPCDPIRRTTKRKADQAVKNGKYIIQDVVNFYEWLKQDCSVIKLIYLSIEDYETSEILPMTVSKFPDCHRDN